MRSRAPFVSSAIYRVLLAMPERVVSGIEDKARLVQGKGGGAATVVQEVRAGLSLLNPEKGWHPLSWTLVRTSVVGRWLF